MALVVRQTKASVRSTATSIGRTFDSAVLAGSLLIAHGAWFGTGSTASAAFSDNLNGAWGTPAATGVSLEVTDAWLEMAAFPNSAAGTITVTMNPPTASSDNDLTLLEVTGAETSSPRDVGVSNTGTWSADQAVTGNVTTGTLAQAAELVVFSFGHTAATRTMTTDTADGFTQVDENENNATGDAFNVAYKITAVTTSLVCNGALAAGATGETQTWMHIVASYKEAAAVTTKARPPRRRPWRFVRRMW